MNYLKKPFDYFFKEEIRGSVLLFFATLAALIIANSPLSADYQALWQTQLKIGTPNFNLEKPLILWINDGLMAIFFFVIGLEIKREILVGELNNIQKASLPIFGAIGGMIIPVVIFFAFQQGSPENEGWGIAMATDIAFTLGILQLLGKRVPLGLKVFLTAFAIVDDIGAVLVIAIFYSTNIQWLLILIALAIIVTFALLAHFKLFSKHLFFVASFVVWVLFLKSGIHPTIAGILLALIVPVHRKLNTPKFYKRTKDAIQVVCDNEDDEPRFLTGEQRGALSLIEDLTEKTISPLQHLEHKLHGYVTYLIMPVFAFANAGVVFGGQIASLSLVIATSMILGKFLGIASFAIGAVKIGWAKLPENVNQTQIIGISFLGGLGFTMALFISGLAYTDAALIESSKTGILIGSLTAGLIGFLLLKYAIKNVPMEEESED
jgi:NhaA family Na+:H+ antiporter